MSTPLFIYGSSGHAKVVIDVAEKMGGFDIRGMLDDNPVATGSCVMGYPVLGGAEILTSLDPKRDRIFVAIGSNTVRQRIGRRLIAAGFALPALVHPAAVIGREVMIGQGTVIMAGVVVNPATVIGSLCILNTCCSVDHDGRIGEAVHVSPGARLAGNVSVGEGSWVGIGSSIIEGRTIGCRCMIGGGAVVIDDVADDTTAVGVPARAIRRGSAAAKAGV
ncbi:MAG TPA: acetyltransferase [bacterium]|jgi:sugar O-acyltransferase (sialic acid O-acetyltransferase NeuD family)